MKPAKPTKVFHVRDASGEQWSCYGETFFLARAAVARDLGVEPGEVRLYPPRKIDNGDSL